MGIANFLPGQAFNHYGVTEITVMSHHAQLVSILGK
jgi:hypothetical protein